jgi:hypothetical protein
LRFLKGGRVRRRRVEGHKLLPEAIREGIARDVPLLPGCQSPRPNFLQFFKLLAFGSWRRTLDLLLSVIPGSKLNQAQDQCSPL